MSKLNKALFGDAIAPRALVYELLNHEQLKDVSAVTISKWIFFSSNHSDVSDGLIRRYKSSKCKADISFRRLMIISEGIYGNVSKSSDLAIMIENIFMFYELAMESNEWNHLTHMEQALRIKAMKKNEKKIEIEKNKDIEEFRSCLRSLSNDLDHQQIVNLVIKTLNEIF